MQKKEIVKDDIVYTQDKVETIRRIGVGEAKTFKAVRFAPMTTIYTTICRLNKERETKGGTDRFTVVSHDNGTAYTIHHNA